MGLLDLGINIFPVCLIWGLMNIPLILHINMKCQKGSSSPGRIRNREYAWLFRLFGALRVYCLQRLQLLVVVVCWGLGARRHLRSFCAHYNVLILSLNPISGRLLATPISGRGLFRTPLISRDLTGRFSKFKRHSIPLNVIYISKKYKSEKYKYVGITGRKTATSDTF